MIEIVLVIVGLSFGYLRMSHSRNLSGAVNDWGALYCVYFFFIATALEVAPTSQEAAAGMFNYGAAPWALAAIPFVGTIFGYVIRLTIQRANS